MKNSKIEPRIGPRIGPKKHIEKPRNKLVRSPVDPSGIFSIVYKYLFSTAPEPAPEPGPEPEVLPEPLKCYSNIFENEDSFKLFIDSYGINAYISDLTNGRYKAWEGLKESEIFERYGVTPDDNNEVNKVNSIFKLYNSYFPYSTGFDEEYYQNLKTQCRDKFFSISSDSENTLCPRLYNGPFIYKLIYNNETKVYTLHFFGSCKDKGCKDVDCMGEGGKGQFVGGISVDHSYIYREENNECVVMAGQVSILGRAAIFDNSSGHYRPDPISPEIGNVIRKIMDKVSFHCIIDGGGRKYKKHKKKIKNKKKRTKRRKSRSNLRSKKSKTKRIRKIR